eukprot:6938410-Prymnesium_polylepis.1
MNVREHYAITAFPLTPGPPSLCCQHNASCDGLLSIRCPVHVSCMAVGPDPLLSWIQFSIGDHGDRRNCKAVFEPQKRGRAEHTPWGIFSRLVARHLEARRREAGWRDGTGGGAGSADAVVLHGPFSTAARRRLSSASARLAVLAQVGAAYHALQPAAEGDVGALDAEERELHVHLQGNRANGQSGNQASKPASHQAIKPSGASTASAISWTIRQSGNQAIRQSGNQAIRSEDRFCHLLQRRAREDHVGREVDERRAGRAAVGRRAPAEHVRAVDAQVERHAQQRE